MWIRSFQNKLQQFKKEQKTYEEASNSSISQSYAFNKKLPTSIAKICDLLLCIDPIWSMGAATFVYLSVFHIVGGYTWFGLVVGVLPFIARWISYGYLSRYTPFDLPIGLLLVAGMIGIGVSSDRSLSWNVYQTLLISILFYYSFINYDHPRLLIKGGLLIAALALIVLVPYIWLQQPTSLPFFSQLQSWLSIDPPSTPPGWSTPPLAASASGVIVAAEVVIVITAGIAVFPGRKTTRIAAGILTLLLLWGLVIAGSTGSKATWPVLTVGMVFILAWRSKWFLFSLPVWLVVAYLSLTSWRGWDFGHAVDIVIDEFQWKWDVRWYPTLSWLADSPITGLGLGMFPAVYSDKGRSIYPHLHNAYLQVLCDFGLLGAIALIIAAVIFIKLVFQVRKSSSNHPWLGITVGSCAAILIGALYSLVESAPACIWAARTDDSYYYAISPLFAILAAALVVSYRSLVIQSYNHKAEEGSEEYL